MNQTTNSENKKITFLKGKELLKYIDVLEKAHNFYKYIYLILLFFSTILILNYLIGSIYVIDGSQSTQILSYLYNHLEILKDNNLFKFLFELLFLLFFSIFVSSIIVLIEFQSVSLTEILRLFVSLGAFIILLKFIIYTCAVNKLLFNFFVLLSNNIIIFIFSSIYMILIIAKFVKKLEISSYFNFLKLFFIQLIISLFNILYLVILYSTIFVFLFYLVFQFSGLNLNFKDFWVSLSLTVISYIINKKFEEKRNVDISILNNVKNKLSKIPYKIIASTNGEYKDKIFGELSCKYKKKYENLILKSYEIPSRKSKKDTIEHDIHSANNMKYNRNIIRSKLRELLDLDLFIEILKDIWSDSTIRKIFQKQYEKELENILNDEIKNYSLKVNHDTNYFLDFFQFTKNRDISLKTAKELFCKKEENFEDYIAKKNLEFMFNFILYLKINGIYFKDILDDLIGMINIKSKTIKNDYEEELKIIKKALDQYYEELEEKLKNEIKDKEKFKEMFKLINEILEREQISEVKIKDFGDIEKYVKYKRSLLLKNILKDV